MKDSSPLSRPAVAAALALIPCFLWGSAVPCIKIGCQLFQLSSGDIPGQLVFAGIRFSIAGLMVIVFASIRARRPLIRTDPFARTSSWLKPSP